VSASTFVDTSVLVWVYDSQDLARRHRAHSRLRREADSGQPTTSSNVLAELFVALTKTKGRPGRQALMTRELAAVAVRQAATLVVVPTTRDHVIDALELGQRHQLQFWDALNIATALAAGYTRYWTCDIPAARITGLGLEDPTL
jgi:predicted nucleic acid-binding protein